MQAMVVFRSKWWPTPVLPYCLLLFRLGAADESIWGASLLTYGTTWPIRTSSLLGRGAELEVSKGGRQTVSGSSPAALGGYD